MAKIACSFVERPFVAPRETPYQTAPWAPRGRRYLYLLVKQKTFGFYCERLPAVLTYLRLGAHNSILHHFRLIARLAIDDLGLAGGIRGHKFIGTSIRAMKVWCRILIYATLRFLPRTLAFPFIEQSGVPLGDPAVMAAVRALPSDPPSARRTARRNRPGVFARRSAAVPCHAFAGSRSAAARLRSSPFITLPVPVRGSASTNRTCFGFL